MKNAFAVLFGLAMAVALTELGLRVLARFHAPVRYLVTAGDAPDQPVFPTLEAYLASRPDVVPHRDFLGYWTNTFGLHDIEFVTPKPRGRFRIMALGDSFTYGSAPYPDAVMTRVEETLRARCSRMDLDLLNFGIGGLGVWDYKVLFELAGPTFDPDLVVVNLYLGNDGQDLFTRPPRFRRVPSGASEVLPRTLRNQPGEGRGRPRSPRRGRRRAPAVVGPRTRSRRREGGRRRRASAGAPPADRADLQQGHVPRDHVGRVSALRPPAVGPSVERTWAPTLAVLDLLRHQVARQGRRMVIALYPSVLQVDPEARARLEEALRLRPDVTGGSAARRRSPAP